MPDGFPRRRPADRGLDPRYRHGRLDCAEVSAAAWPSLRDGIHSTVTVDDAQARVAVRELAQAGMAIGDPGAAPLAAVRALVADPDCSSLRESIGLGPESRVLLVATEGRPDRAQPRRARSASFGRR